MDAPYIGLREEPYDAIVVGSGISGGWAAKELTEKGLRVLVLERGRKVEHVVDYPTEHKAPWEFPFRLRKDRKQFEERSPIQQLCYAYNEDTSHFFVDDQKHRYATDTGFRWIRGYHTGGRSLMWARQSYRLSDLDFEANLKDGYGVDWPIRYADIAPWYSHVERFAGISGQSEGLSQLPDGEFLPPMQMNCAEKLFKDGVESRFPDRRVTIGRSAVLTVDHNGRQACHSCGPCHRGCSTGSYFSSQSATLPAAAATGRMTIINHAIVERLIYDDAQGRVSGVHVIDEQTKESREYTAKMVFMCASTLGTTQIMLNSTSRTFPDGIANSSGVLGKYLMDHPNNAGANATLPAPEDRYYNGHRPNGIYIPRFRNLGDRASHRDDFLRGYGYQAGGSRAGYHRGIDQAGFGAALKEQLRYPGPWNMWVGGYGEQLPRAENHVYLDPTETDEWGIPILHVHCEWSDNERAMRKDMMEQAAEMCEAAGATDIRPFDHETPPGFCIHEMGTARMGHDPKTSVLNKWNQAHDVPNLFVTDGSFMTSNACQNPSLTYMAFTARAADYAAKELREGRIS